MTNLMASARVIAHSHFNTTDLHARAAIDSRAAAIETSFCDVKARRVT